MRFNFSAASAAVNCRLNLNLRFCLSREADTTESFEAIDNGDYRYWTVLDYGLTGGQCVLKVTYFKIVPRQLFTNGV